MLLSVKILYFYGQPSERLSDIIIIARFLVPIVGEGFIRFSHPMCFFPFTN